MAKRGDIYQCSIINACGHEMTGSRPGVVISCDDVNARGGTAVVAFCSDACQIPGDPYVVPVSSGGTKTNAIVYKLSCVDSTRLLKKIGSCSQKEMQGIMKALAATFDLDAPPEPAEDDGLLEANYESQIDDLERELLVVETRLGDYQDICKQLMETLA